MLRRRFKTLRLGSALLRLLAAVILLCIPSSLRASDEEVIIAFGIGFAGDYFGASARGAGDVNGDGYGDFIVGAPGFNNDQGRAYVFHGGPAIDAIAEWTMTGESMGDNFGATVASAGDVDGDGCDDVIVGALNAGPSLEGRSYLYLMGAGADSVPDYVFHGVVGEGLSVVSGAGDVNDDGFDDLVIGAPFNSDVATNAGKAYVYFMGPVADTTADLTFSGSESHARFGDFVGTTGNQMGNPATVLVGVPFDDFYGVNAGRVQGYLGGAGADDFPDFTIPGVPGSLFGHTPGVVDVDGDGFRDLMAAAPGAQGIPEYVHVFVDSFTVVSFPGENPDDRFGFAARSAGDVNGDGYEDLVVGAPSYDDGESISVGRVYVYFLGPAGDTVPDITITGPAEADQIGWDVDTVGDVDGDGRDDFIIGAPFRGTNDRGRIWVYGVPASTVDAPVVAPAAASVRLSPPRPNPIRSGAAAEIAFELPSEGRVSLELFDLAGRRVVSREPERFAAGAGTTLWDLPRLASGVYLVRLEAEGHAPVASRMVVID